MCNHHLSEKAESKWETFIHRDLSNYHPLDYKTLADFIIQSITDNCEVDIYFIETQLKNNRYDEKLIKDYITIFESMNFMARFIKHVYDSKTI